MNTVYVLMRSDDDQSYVVGIYASEALANHIKSLVKQDTSDTLWVFTQEVLG